MLLRRWVEQKEAAAYRPQRPGRELPLRWRLVLLVVASIFPLLIFILGYEYSGYHKDVTATGQQTLIRARGLASVVEEQFRARVAVLQALAVSRALREGDIETFRSEAELVVELQFPGAVILVSRPDGQVLMRTGTPSGTDLPVRSNMELLRRVLETGQPTISAAFNGAGAQRVVATIDVPVKSSDGTASYVLSLNPPLDLFAELIQRQRFPEGWVVSIFDREGVNVARVPNGDRFVGKKASESFIGTLLENREGIIETTSLEGTPLLTAFSHDERFGWSVGIGVPKAELIGPIVESITRTTLLGVSLLGLSLGLAFYAARRIAGPIQSLRRLVSVFDMEEFRLPAPTGVREVDEVARAFYIREEARRDSQNAEAILRYGIETIPEGFSVYDDKDRLVMCNEKFRSLSDDTENILIPGSRYEDFLRAGIRKGRYVNAKGREDEWIAERLRVHRSGGGVVEQQLSDGSWVLIHKHRLSNGWIAGLRIDITALKVVQTALTESEALLNDAINSISGGFVITDSEDRLVRFNSRLAELYPDCVSTLRYGGPYRDFLWARVKHGYYPDAIGREEAWFNEALARHKGANMEAEIRLHDGRWLLVTERPMSNGGIAGVSIDITLQKMAEEALRRSEGQFRHVVESVPNAILTVNRDGIIEMVNAQAERIFGYARNDLLKKSIETLLPADLRERHPALRTSFFEKPEARLMGIGRDLYAVRKDGQKFPVEVGLNPLETDGGMLVLASIIDITERKQYEVQLIEARRRTEAVEALLRDAIESVSGGFVITDAEDRLVLFNRHYQNYYPDCGATLRPGVPYRDFLQERIRRGYYPHAKGREDAWFAEVMERHLAAKGEIEIALPDGRCLLLSERRMSDGSIAGLCLDISALKAAEDARRHSEEQFRHFFETSPDLIVVTDRIGTLLRVSPSVQPMLGYDPDELIGRSAVVLVHPEDLDATRDQMRKARRAGTVQNFECRYLHKQGHPVALWWAGTWSPSERQHFFIGRDVTDRKETERRLRESEEQLRNAQRLAHMGSVRRNLQTDEAEWSDETYRIFGMSRETFVPTAENIAALVHPDDREKFLALNGQLAQGISAAPYEYRIVRPDGSVRHIHREHELIEDANGKPVYFVGTIQDVTERRQTEEQLRQAQKMEAIGNLTGGMAHDFNNLLGIMVGNLGLAIERVTGDLDTEEMIRDSLDAAWRGADLTRRLLAFARRQPLRPVPIKVNDLIADTTRLLQRLLGEDIEIRLELAADLWSVVADPAQLEASLANLATNARDAMPGGGHLILATANRYLDADYVAAHADASEGDFVMIEVSDTGAGMPAEVMSRIFEPFFTTKEAGKGTGLGLSMVFGFLRQSGGHVSVYSEPGAGTTFRLYLPRSTSDGVVAKSVRERVVEHGAGEKVLVVEDNPGVRRAVVRQLRDLGYIVLECERATEALETLHREEVDLLFTDIVMPGGLDGVELARLARERWRDLKIVLTSGFPQTRVDLAQSPLSSLRLLSKPYSNAELAAVLRATLSQ